MKRLCLALSALLMAAACSQPTPVDTTVADTSNPSPEPSPSPTMPIALEGPLNDLGTVDMTSSGSSVSLDMSIEEFGFDPTFIKVSPSSNVTVELAGEEGADHTFTIDSLGVDKDLPSGPIDTFSLAAASAEGTTFQLPAEGPVLFYCRFHVDQGMKGAFYFTDDDQVEASPFPEADSSDGGSSSSGGSGPSGGTSSRRSTSSRSSGPSSAQQSEQPSGGNPPVDPLDEEIMRAVTGQTEPEEDPPSGEATSKKGTPTEKDAGVADVSGPGSPGADAPSGEKGESAEDGEAGEEGTPGETTTISD
ncbi:MAG: cupredoxin domain-containing protein [Actinomycetota bacterium]